LGLAPAILLLAACAGSANERTAQTVVDDDGRALVVAAPARVLSALPAVTELIVVLAPDRLVARTDWDDDPRIAHLPSLGRTLAPTPEAVLRHAPDLVILGPGPDAGRGPLEAAGLPVYVADVRDTAGIASTIQRIGRLLGEGERADSLARALRAGLAAVHDAIAGLPAPSVLYALWTDPIWTTGAGTFVDELIGVAGGRNVFHDLDRPWAEVALEEVVRRDPDVIVLGGGMSNIGRLYERVPTLWREHVFSDSVETRLVRNRHGDSSGVRGAAWVGDDRAFDAGTFPAGV